MEKPYFLVTVDTEGDDLWSRPESVTTENARFLPRFQSLCERYACRPTYLATYEMACCPEFRAFGRRVLRRERAEIGTHLHAWNSPPERPLTERDSWHQPHLTNYPEDVMRQKLMHLTRVLEEAFDVPMRSHRGGRWAFNETYARLLDEQGYDIDSTVTPHVSWQQRTGDRFEQMAPDYRGFPEGPYFVDLNDISRAGTSRLLELPMTTCKVMLDASRPARDGSAPFVVRWLRPNGRNGNALRSIVRQSLEEARPCLVLMLHSSELMPGGSPVTERAEDVEALYRDLESLFRGVADTARGVTMSELYAAVSAVRNVEDAVRWNA